MDSKQKSILKAIFFFVSMIAFGTIFILGLVAGLLLHLDGNPLGSVPRYFLSVTAAVGTVWVFMRGKKMLSVGGYA